MRTVEEHQAVVAALLAPLDEEEVPLAAAHNRVLARDVTAQVPLPGFDNSAMDGFAFDGAALKKDAPLQLEVVGTALASSNPANVLCARITAAHASA